MKIVKSDKESTFLSVVENIPDCIVRYDRDFRHIYLNKAGISLYDCKKEYILGKTHRESELFDQNQCDFWEEKLGFVFSKGNSLHEDFEWNNNGEALWYDLLLTPETDSQENIVSVLAVLRDITKYKVNEKALFEKDEIFKNFIEHSPIYVFFKDADIRSLYLSKNYELMLGKPLDELLGKTMYDLFPSDLAKKMISDDMDILKKGVPATIEEELNGKYYSTIKFPILIEGKPMYLAGYTIDITEKKKAEKEIFEREAKLQSIFRAAPVGIGLVVDRVLMEVNDTLCNLLGYKREELLGNSSELLYPDRNEYEYVGKIKYDLILKKGIGSVETRLKCRDGKVIDVILSSVPLDINDHSKGVTFTVLDITDRHKIETELKSSLSIINASLESTTDGMLIVDGKGTIIKWNQKFAEMWGLPAELLNKHDDNAAINFILNKLSDPDMFLRIVRDLYAHPEKSSFDRLEFKDGQIFERFSQPQKIDNVIVGRVWSFRDITEQYRAEQSLKLSEEKFRSIAENLSDLIFITDIEGIIKYISPALKMFGYKAEDCIGRFFGEFVSDGEIEKAISVFKNALNSINIDKSVTLLFKRSDGSTFYAELSGSAYMVGDELSGVLGLLRDVTEKVAQDTDLRKLSRVVEQNPASILITDLEGNIEYVNPKLCEITGYTRDELIGKTPAIFSSGKKSKAEYQELWDTIKAGFDWKGEFNNVKKNGGLYWESALISPIYGSTGLPTHYLAIKEDISEKKRSEQRLVESEKRYYELFISNPVPTYVFDEKTLAFVEVNEATVQSYGYSREEFNNMSLADIRLEEDIPELMESLKSLNSDFFHSASIRHVKKDGTVFPVEINSHALPEKDGRKTRLVMATDITERIKAADQMKIAKEKAEASDKLKTTFLNNISHEVRTPLNGILGFAEIVSRHELSSEDRKQSLTMLYESSERLLTTISNYMDISLITSGNLSFQLKEFIPGRILKTIYESYISRAEGKNLQLLLEIPENAEKFTVISDPEIFRKIVSHLLNNAVKFTEHGSIRFGFSVVKSELEFFIKDTGIGIATESVENIFEHFVKEDRGPSRLSEGSGLGLSIIKGMTDILGLKLRVESEIDVGSSFYFTIPVIKNPEIILNERTRYKVVDPVNKATILVAEDDEINFLYLKTLLSHEIHATILHASNGREALELFKANPDISIILMDIKMPEIDGLEATRLIKNVNKNIPVIAITAYAMSGDEEKVIAAGCDGYLSKPLTRSSLLNKISEFITI